MSKFNRFKILVSSKVINNHCINHGKTLGYDLESSDDDFHGGIWFSEDMQMQTCNSDGYIMKIEAIKEISLYDFFKLTPEDVRTEPERLKVAFGLMNGMNQSSKIQFDITQDQIDRIKAIMDES